MVVGRDGKLHGFSTDGPGFAHAAEEAFGVSLGTLRVAVLGAGGGTGRAVTMQCAQAGCPRLFLQNRSAEKLQPLAEDIAREFPQCSLQTSPLDELPVDEIDLFVNCSALGMKADDPSVLPAERLRARHLVYDTIYTAARTPFMRAADAAGASAANGLPMLLHQGALSFAHWFGQKPPLDVMRAALEAVAPR
jgi:shikimate dehydrogenase